MKKMETTWGAGLVYSIFLLFICFWVVVFIIDWFQIGNIKETLDNDLKRTITESVVVYINDKYSTDRKAALTEEDKQNLDIAIRDRIQTTLEPTYNYSLQILSLEVIVDDKVYVKYKAETQHPLLAANKKVSIPVRIVGRSKAQRFDG